MADPAGEADGGALRLDFDRRVMLRFYGSAITSDGGLLTYHELDDVLALTTRGGERLAEARTGRNRRRSQAAPLSSTLERTFRAVEGLDRFKKTDLIDEGCSNEGPFALTRPSTPGRLMPATGYRQRQTLNCAQRSSIMLTAFAGKADGARAGTMAEIFVSYTSSDHDWAMWIATELKAFGHTPHVHEWEIGLSLCAYWTASVVPR